MTGSKPIVLAIVTATLCAGCAHANVQAKPQTVEDQRPHESSTQVAAAPKPSDATPQEETAHKELSSQLQNTRLFFGYDDATLTDESKQLLSRIGDILSKNPRLSVRIEGNCDERGTEAYNLSLGQKRADTAKKYLTTMGATDGQISTISYGAERPSAQGHDESAWKQNRRDELIVNSGQ